ncbi:MAG: LysM peptidoglycan-binding domain-containing protein [Chitinophagales bacterium]|nr:LysM peptidoglycan-binding domain-containing protein [Chitinophagales bacterium]
MKAVFLFAFSCLLTNSATLFAQTDSSIASDPSLLPGQFESDDSLNALDNSNIVIDSLQPDKISFADVNVPAYADSVYEARIHQIALVSGVPFVYNSEVRKYIDLYVLNRREQVSRMVGLSKMYFPIFDQIMDQYGVPRELKYLSIIESALNPHAVSRCGATGIWQFMYGTAKLYGLNINSYVDERKDIIRATEGAAQYLKSMYEIYGDWLLAIASYNCGPGNINKAISRSGGNTFWDVQNYLPRETRAYVPAFIAAAYVMNYYDQYELSPTYPQYIYDSICTVDVSGRMTCDVVAKFMDMSVEEIKFLNPGLRSNVIPGLEDIHYFFKLPSSKISRYDEKKDSMILYSKNVKTLFEGGYDPTGRVTYTVRSGDNLGKIASRYHVSVTQLKKWNGLRSSTVHKGQHLKIYSSHNATGAIASSSTSNSVKKPISSNTRYVYYKAKYGDTLSTIAQRHGTTISALKAINGPSKCNNLKAGTVLKISLKG